MTAHEEKDKEQHAGSSETSSAGNSEEQFSGDSGAPSAREIFGERADRYAELDVFSEEEFYRPLLDLAAPGPGERVLDLAAGTGLLTLMIARSGAEVVAADVTPEMLAMARKRLEAGKASGNAAAAEADDYGNVSFVEAGIPALPFADESFDLVTCRLAFHHFPDPSVALAEIRRVLKTGGRFVMEDVFGPEDKERSTKRERLEKLFDPSHVRAYPQRELRALLKAAGFNITREYEPYTKGLPVDFMLKLERIEDPADRDEIIQLLKENLGVDLVGFRTDEVGGELQLSWQTIIFAAVRV